MPSSVSGTLHLTSTWTCELGHVPTSIKPIHACRLLPCYRAAERWYANHAGISSSEYRRSGMCLKRQISMSGLGCFWLTSTSRVASLILLRCVILVSLPVYIGCMRCVASKCSFKEKVFVPAIHLCTLLHTASALTSILLHAIWTCQVVLNFFMPMYACLHS